MRCGAIVVLTIVTGCGSGNSPSDGATAAPPGATSGTPLPDPGPTVTTGTVGASLPPGATGASSSSGGQALQMATPTGLFVVDHPLAGEPSVAGFVLVIGGGLAAAPADTEVTLNGVTLVHAPGLAAGYFAVDPTKPQPELGADGYLHLLASSPSTKAQRALNLACPDPVPVTTMPAPGTSLAGVATLALSWTAALPVNMPVFQNAGLVPPVTVSLWAVDDTRHATALDGHWLTTASASATLSVQPAPGYVAELRYPGVYFLDGNTGGICGRTIRASFTR